MQKAGMVIMLNSGDKNIVANIRFDYKDMVKDFSDEHIAETWRHFSQSEDYPDKDKFLEWLKSE